MYGADWCGDCLRAKSFLNERDVAFAYVDLVAHPEFMAAVMDRNQGARRIPVIVFPDGSHLTEPSNIDLAAKLDEMADAPGSP
ncbi:MAG: NrdH-redoxin [Acidimicrobiia bacterium]|nr:NrdH-redoxin [Acidimicrobiia bacterium]MBT8250900.1 NrdH-redoxin [Acidimicrobiia bacterium]NNC43451.1 NrdH-redoxin [Acidimicrobiia bacterium]NNL29065.1 NrdH-redoxin [Acidimicrobiia bacterium]